MTDFDTLLGNLRAHVPDMLALTRRLVLMNSYSKNVAGVNATGELLQTAFALDGLSLRRESGEGCGDHLFWSTYAAENEAPILIIGHHDTVFPPGSFEG